MSLQYMLLEPIKEGNTSAIARTVQFHSKQVWFLEGAQVEYGFAFLLLLWKWSIISISLEAGICLLHLKKNRS